MSPRRQTNVIYTQPDARPSRASGSTENPAEIALYIAELTTELAALAGTAKLDLLAYFLSMARVEAETLARGLPPAKPGKSERP